MKTFTPNQTKAIHAGSVAIIAGPGSGKTSTLVEKIRFLIQELGHAPEDFIVITFTNAAAREIEKRIKEALGEVEKPALRYAGTIHGLALRLLKEGHAFLNLPEKITTLNEDEAKALLLDCQNQMKVKATQKELYAALEHGPGYYLEQQNFSGPMCVAWQYYKTLKSAGIMDFDSLLRFADLLITKTEFKPKTVRFLFWDEVQDSGLQDWNIIRHFPASQRTLIGDPDQSIYGFRGARPDIFFQNLAIYEEVILEENFRCAPNICETANELIAHNTGRIKKETKSARLDAHPGEVAIWNSPNEEEEVREIAEEINTARNYNECAVLLRTNALVDRFTLRLMAFGIPVVTRKYKQMPEDWPLARGVISLLANPDNDLLMKRFLARLYGQPEADKIKLEALREFKTIRESLEARPGFSDLFPRNASFSDLPTILARHRVGPESIELVVRGVALLPDDATLSELSYALADDELHLEETGEGVTVTTIHSAKGREWDTVFLPAFEVGVIPSPAKSANIEEERRLAFVAITRARKHLIFTTSKTRAPQFGNGKPAPTTPSHFLAEAGL